MEEDDLSPEHQPRGAGAGGPHGGGAAPPMHMHMHMQAGAPAPTHGRTSAEVAQMFQEREPLIPGLNHAAERPQVHSCRRCLPRLSCHLAASAATCSHQPGCHGRHTG